MRDPVVAVPRDVIIFIVGTDLMDCRPGTYRYFDVDNDIIYTHNIICASAAAHRHVHGSSQPRKTVIVVHIIYIYTHLLARIYACTCRCCSVYALVVIRSLSDHIDLRVCFSIRPSSSFCISLQFVYLHKIYLLRRHTHTHTHTSIDR